MKDKIKVKVNSPVLNDKDWKILIAKLKENFEKPKDAEEYKRIKALYDKFKEKGIEINKRDIGCEDLS